MKNPTSDKNLAHEKYQASLYPHHVILWLVGNEYCVFGKYAAKTARAIAKPLKKQTARRSYVTFPASDLCNILPKIQESQIGHGVALIVSNAPTIDEFLAN